MKEAAEKKADEKREDAGRKQEKAYVINLATRPDRLAQFYKGMKDGHKKKVERFDAFEVPGRGWLGCARSHIAVLEKALAENLDRVTVFEDDFVWRDGKKDVDEALRGLDFDVFLLAGRLVEKEEVEKEEVEKEEADAEQSGGQSGGQSKAEGSNKKVRVRKAFTTVGYIVNKHYVPILLENFKEAEQLLDKHVKSLRDYRNVSTYPYAIDIWWQQLQKKDKWYSTLPTLGKQCDGYSNIERIDCKHNY